MTAWMDCYGVVHMKTVHFIPPVIALVIAVALLGAQRSSISTLEAESGMLQKRINAAEFSPQLEHPADRRSGRPNQLVGRPNQLVKQEIDWKEMAEAIGDDMEDSSSGTRKLLSLEGKLEAMDTDELIAALDRIATLELDDMQRMMLENLLIRRLAEKDPELGLIRYADRFGDKKMGRDMSHAVDEWAKKDPAAAAAWLDKQIAAGIFESKSLDGKNQSRMAIEVRLIASMLGSDPGSAEARIAALPANQRQDVIQQLVDLQMKAEEYAAFADLARGQLSEKEKMEVMGKQASYLVMRGDFQKVDEYMDRIAATPDERIRSAEDAARTSIQGKASRLEINASQLDPMREWLSAHAPGSVNRITGEAIGGAMNHGESMLDFSAASVLALKYHAESGSDEVLTAFLEKAQVGKHKEEARSIAEKISDPQAREKALERLK